MIDATWLADSIDDYLTKQEQEASLQAAIDFIDAKEERDMPMKNNFLWCPACTAPPRSVVASLACTCEKYNAKEPDDVDNEEVEAKRAALIACGYEPEEIDNLLVEQPPEIVDKLIEVGEEDPMVPYDVIEPLADKDDPENDDDIWCDWCGDDGHVIENCDVADYLPYGIKTAGATTSTPDDLFCSTCHGEGHEAGNCKLNDMNPAAEFVERKARIEKFTYNGEVCWHCVDFGPGPSNKECQEHFFGGDIPEEDNKQLVRFLGVTHEGLDPDMLTVGETYEVADEGTVSSGAVWVKIGTTKMMLLVGEWEPVNDDTEPTWYEDEDHNLIPSDPNEKCHSRATGAVFACTCLPVARNECVKCGVGREWPSHAWRPIREDGEYNVAKRNKQEKRAQKKKEYQASPNAKNTIKSSGAPAAGPTKTTGQASKTVAKTSTAPAKPSGPGPNSPQVGATKPATPDTPGAKFAKNGQAYVGAKDRHYGDPYKLAASGTTIYASSSWNNRKEGEFVPDFGLYFDWGWHPYWRNEHIDWRDFGVPENFDIALEQLTDALAKAKAGKKVEMGCIGAHGRTGTAFAVLNVMEGTKPKEAIDHVRKNHCLHAIENKVQEWFVEWVYAKLNNLPLPEKPVVQSKTTTTTNKTPTTCTKIMHWQAWVNLPSDKYAVCPINGLGCAYWEEDFNDFLGGKYQAVPKLSISLSDHDQIDGKWLFPRPKNYVDKHKTPAAINKHSNKLGCFCDVCRYLELGYQAFLCPSETQAKANHLKWQDEWEAHVNTKIAVRKKMEIAQIIADNKDKLGGDKMSLLNLLRARDEVPLDTKSVKTYQAEQVKLKEKIEREAAAKKAAEAKANQPKTLVQPGGAPIVAGPTKDVNSAAKKPRKEMVVNTIKGSDIVIHAGSPDDPEFSTLDVGCEILGPGLPTGTLIDSFIVKSGGVRLDTKAQQSGCIKVTVLPWTLKPAPKDNDPAPVKRWGEDAAAEQTFASTHQTDDNIVKLALPDGTMIDVAINDEFNQNSPPPPDVVCTDCSVIARPGMKFCIQCGKAILTPRAGDVSGDYVYDAKEGWVNIKLINAKAAQMGTVATWNVDDGATYGPASEKENLHS